MIVTDSQCFSCRHFNKKLASCSAFPDGIPREIFGNIFPGEDLIPHDHRQPFPGDNGIRFAALPGMRHPLDVIEPTKEAKDGQTPTP
jgi:hypothetical protein